MKRIAYLVLVGVLGAGVVGAQEMKKDDSMKSGMKTMTASGTVTKVDEAGKVLMVKDASGKEVTINWNDATKVTGKLAEGSMATVEYMMMDGKMMAHSVKVTGAPNEKM